MKRFAVSGTYTAAFFFASLIVTVLILRNNGAEAQARFFYFQAIFYVLSTVISQALTLNVFQNTSLRRAGLVMDAAAFVSVVAFLAASRSMGFSGVEQLCFAAASVLLYRGSAQMISVQFYSGNAMAMLWVPLLALALRVAAAWAVVDQGPAVMFLANGLAAFAVPTLVLLAGLVRPDPARAAPQKGQGASQGAIFAFFLVGATTFQWERILYGILQAPESLLITGYVMTVVLPPLSSLFATLYRGDARQIFAQGDPAAQARQFRKTGGLFAAASALYLAVLALFWPQVMALLGAKVVPQVWLVLLLGAAIVVDRLAHLLVFLGQRDALYRRAVLLKGAVVACAAGGAYLLGSDRPEMNYLVFLAGSLIYLGGVASGRR